MILPADETTHGIAWHAVYCVNRQSGTRSFNAECTPAKLCTAKSETVKRHGVQAGTCRAGRGAALQQRRDSTVSARSWSSGVLQYRAVHAIQRARGSPEATGSVAQVALRSIRPCESDLLQCGCPCPSR